MSNTTPKNLANIFLKDLGIAFTNITTQRLEDLGVEEVSSHSFSLKADNAANYLFELAKPEMDKHSGNVKCYWGKFANLKTNELVAKPTLVLTTSLEEKERVEALRIKLGELKLYPLVPKSAQAKAQVYGLREELEEAKAELETLLNP